MMQFSLEMVSLALAYLLFICFIKKEKLKNVLNEMFGKCACSSYVWILINSLIIQISKKEIRFSIIGGDGIEAIIEILFYVFWYW